MGDLKNVSYRSLEHVCREQAALSSHEETRALLEAVAAEYRKLADRLERQSLGDIQSE